MYHGLLVFETEEEAEEAKNYIEDEYDEAECHVSFNEGDYGSEGTWECSIALTYPFNNFIQDDIYCFTLPASYSFDTMPY